MTLSPTYDVAVIGAGLVGSAVARELAAYQLSVALIEMLPYCDAVGQDASMGRPDGAVPPTARASVQPERSCSN